MKAAQILTAMVVVLCVVALVALSQVAPSSSPSGPQPLLEVVAVIDQTSESDESRTADESNAEIEIDNETLVRNDESTTANEGSSDLSNAATESIDPSNGKPLSPISDNVPSKSSQEANHGTNEPTTNETNEPTTNETNETTTNETNEPTTNETNEPTSNETNELTSNEPNELPKIESKVEQDNQVRASLTTNSKQTACAAPGQWKDADHYVYEDGSESPFGAYANTSIADVADRLMSCLGGQRIIVAGNSIMRGVFFHLQALLARGSLNVELEETAGSGNRTLEKMQCGPSFTSPCESTIALHHGRGSVYLKYYWTQTWSSLGQLIRLHAMPETRESDRATFLISQIGLHHILDKHLTSFQQALAVLEREGPPLRTLIESAFRSFPNGPQLLMANLTPMNPDSATFRAPGHIKIIEDVLTMNNRSHALYAYDGPSAPGFHNIDQHSLIHTAKDIAPDVYPVDALHPGLAGREAQASQLMCALCDIVSQQRQDKQSAQ